MKISLNHNDINLQKMDNGKFKYKIHETEVEGLESKVAAIKHAEENFTEFIKEKYFKK